MVSEVERITKPKAGDVIHIKHRHWDGETIVKAACESKNGGHWWCVTHNEGFDTQLTKDGHINRGKHHLVWWCHEHGPEEP